MSLISRISDLATRVATELKALRGQIPSATGPSTLLSTKDTRYYSVQGINGTGNTTGVANRSLCIPVHIGKTLTPNRLGMRTNGFSANTNIRMAIYADANGQPGTLLHESGVILVTATATNYEHTLTAAELTPGWYWFCLIMAGNSIVPLGVAIANVIDSLGRTSSGAIIRCLYRDFAFGAFPSDESGQTYVESTTILPPWIYVRTA